MAIKGNSRIDYGSALAGKEVGQIRAAAAETDPNWRAGTCVDRFFRLNREVIPADNAR